MTGCGSCPCCVEWEQAHDEAQATIVELQHQARTLRHEADGERAKFLNEKLLRQRDRKLHLLDGLEQALALAESDPLYHEMLFPYFQRLAVALRA